MKTPPYDKKKPEIAYIGELLREEMARDAKSISPSLFPPSLPDRVKVSQKEYLAFVQSNWQDQQFRQDLLGQVGPKNFINIAKEIGASQLSAAAASKYEKQMAKDYSAEGQTVAMPPQQEVGYGPQ
jgi:uncharacterized protein (DUF2336 family)